MNEEIEYPIRINKYLEQKGIATRRGADELIEQGLVWVNGKKAVLGYKVEIGDTVEIERDGETPEKNYVYLAFNKPRGLSTEEINISTDGEMVFPLGRLDKESEGLILLTNDGRVTDRLLNPKYANEKVYEVEVREKVSPMHKKILEGGIKFKALVRGNAVTLRAKEVEIIDSNNLAITLTEGKKHEIRRMLAGAHLTVASLKRVQIMNIKLGSLAPNKSRPLTSTELKTFLADLGL